jgi:hypothetical protein
MRLRKLKQEWQKSRARDQTNRQQKLGLVWRNRKKISQIIEDYFYLPFFLLIILWSQTKRNNRISLIHGPIKKTFLQNLNILA